MSKKDKNAPNLPNPNYPDFVDRRKRTWEWYSDPSYWDCICVRVKGETDFNSQLSFHFNTYDQAKQFVELLKISS